MTVCVPHQDCRKDKMAAVVPVMEESLSQALEGIEKARYGPRLRDFTFEATNRSDP
ncbi:hypothetical protein [Streptomyces sp. NPDC090021]|uniref:hypothetical protein n=1 Tax=Streptomyces sp. NPDC090021 TaxID=3365919 RepID=UPI00380F8976